MNNIKEFLNKDFIGEIAVIGDCMIDEYYQVSVNSLSPEFPIPKMESHGDQADYSLPGGAANTALQFKNFADVSYFGILNLESAEILIRNGIKVYNCVICEDATVPIKKRFYHGDIPLCRWDIERNDYGLKNLQDIREELYKTYKKKNYAVTILSDYNKGLFDCNTNWISDDTISIVDPKKFPIERWNNCSVFKLNSKEANELSGYRFQSWKMQCDYFQVKLNCISVIITHGDEGVVGKIGGTYFNFDGVVGAANNVIGAGDCYCAFMAMGLAKGMDIAEVVEIANEISGHYVQQKSRILDKRDLIRIDNPIAAKFVSPESLRTRDYQLVMVNGCFDAGLTSNHVEHLKDAKRYGDKLVVALNSDDSIKRIKGNDRPILSLQERMTIIGALEIVDFVVSFDDDTPIELIKKILPDVLAKGGDYCAEEAVGYGIVPIAITPLYDGVSTTDKINLMHKDIV